jgi:hypothetical protein
VQPVFGDLAEQTWSGHVKQSRRLALVPIRHGEDLCHNPSFDFIEGKAVVRDIEYDFVPILCLW